MGASAPLLGGRAADLLGRRRMFVLAVGLYGVGSLVGGFATDPETLIAARAVQGLRGAFTSLQPGAPVRGRRFDVPGAVVATAGVTALVALAIPVTSAEPSREKS